MSNEKQLAESTINSFPDKLNSRHRAIMRLLISGMQQKEIAEALGYDQSRLSIIINSPIFQEELANMQLKVSDKFTEKIAGADADVRVMLKERAIAAFNTIDQLMVNSGNERIKQVSALEILDRAGYNKTDKMEASVSLDASEGLALAIQESMKLMQGPAKPSVYKLEPTREELENKDN